MQGAQFRNIRALDLDLGAHGENHPKVASSQDSLASVLWALGEIDEARQLSERAIGIYERVLGPQHPHLAQSLNTLAFLYYSAGDFAMAEAEGLEAQVERIEGASSAD